MVPGSADPGTTYRLIGESKEHAVRIGAAIGAVLAEQHHEIKKSDVSPWLPHVPSWPKPRDWISDRLTRVIDDVRLIARANAVLEEYENVVVDEVDRVLVHTDVGFHNLAVDADSYTLNGIFDYEGATWADRHHDFRYLVFATHRQDFFEAAAAAYQAASGRPIQRDRVLLYNAACAISFLAFRDGKSAEERWCGRTLEDDLRWSRHAIAKVLDT